MTLLCLYNNIRAGPKIRGSLDQRFNTFVLKHEIFFANIALFLNLDTSIISF